MSFIVWLYHGPERRKNKKQSIGQGIHPLFTIEGGSGQEQVDRITDCAFFKEVAGQTKVVFQVPYDWFYGTTPH